jgi:DNA-binding CsgD family transcriptional regulator
VRRLALAKLRELKRQGLSYREIGRRFGAPPQGEGTRGGPGRRLGPARLLTVVGHPGGAASGQADGNGEDAALFLRALDALDQGLAFFDGAGDLLHGNRPLTELLEEGVHGGRLGAELQYFADALWRLTRLRGLAREQSVEELAVQEVPRPQGHLVLKGSYIGLDLFGTGPSILVVLERPHDGPLSAESLRARFELTRQECRIAQLLAEGSPNADIAAQLMLSPHTIRRHTENILRKLGVRSRAEAVARILRPDEAY